MNPENARRMMRFIASMEVFMSEEKSKEFKWYHGVGEDSMGSDEIMLEIQRHYLTQDEVDDYINSPYNYKKWELMKIVTIHPAMKIWMNSLDGKPHHEYRQLMFIYKKDDKIVFTVMYDEPMLAHTVHLSKKITSGYISAEDANVQMMRYLYERVG